ncbi:hypothetical protein E0I00_14125 [Pseudomonas syringae pv. actinidiae]|nr:hypothetical protein [Pseudomonas syringae pv. actinidiae]
MRREGGKKTGHRVGFFGWRVSKDIDYEALVGVRGRSSNDGEQALICMFGVIEFVSLPGTSIVIPQKLTPAAPPQVVCKN